MITQDTFIALNRFGLGASPAELSVGISSPKSWLNRQMNASSVSPDIFAEFATSDSAIREFTAIKNTKDKDKAKDFKKQSREKVFGEIKARFELGLQTDQPLYERLVHFWSNHFTVSAAGKPYLGLIVSAMEREAIRPHVMGNFADMLIAVSQHPAMLLYLDNVKSSGPNSRVGRRRGIGLNENLAREIMELHTLGVDGGYTQKDVIALAKIITGWSMDRSGQQGFKFIPAIHEPGEKTLLGKVYDQGGQQEGIAALMDLAVHPSTAKFLATKLARHFIADEPSSLDIRTLENAYMRSNGNLKAMYEALLGLSSVWRDPLPKVKTPYELIQSTLRLMNVKTLTDEQFKKIYGSLVLFQHVPYTALSPAGWPDRAEAWISSDALMNRLEWCHAAALQFPVRQDHLETALNYIKPVADAETVTWVSRAPSVKEGMALLLSSRAHQRR